MNGLPSRAEIVLADADAGVAHPEMQPRAEPVGADRDGPALRRELHRVGDEVDQHLLHGAAVGDDLADRLAECRSSSVSDFASACSCIIERHISTASREAERLGLDRIGAAFDLRDVEDRRHHGQQMVRRTRGSGRHIPSAADRRKAPNISWPSMSEKPMIALSGRAQFVADRRQEAALGDLDRCRQLRATSASAARSATISAFARSTAIKPASASSPVARARWRRPG